MMGSGVRIPLAAPVNSKRLMRAGEPGSAKSRRPEPRTLVRAFTALEVEGSILRGRFVAGLDDEQWCDRRLLARIHHYTVARLRSEIEPVAPRGFLSCVGLRLRRSRHGEPHCLRGVEVSVGQTTAPLCSVPYAPNDAEMASFQVRFHCISRRPQVMEATQLWRPSMARGTVKWFNSQKGYGFIQPQAGGKDVFVHISAVEKAGLTGLNEGQTIEYEEVSNRGKTSAENLKVQR
jgi:CspA family cold shock protein